MRLQKQTIDGMISVIIPCYNAENFIKRCVESVVAQDYPSKEIIVIDDGSKDNSWQLCCELKQSYDIVKTWHIENIGVSGARNLGLEKATGEYILFLDADDTLMPKALSNLHKSVIEHNLKCAVGKFYINPTEETAKIDTSYSISRCDSNHRFLNIPGYLIKRQILENMIDFPVGITHSEDFFWGNILVGFLDGVAILDQYTYGYYISDGQAMKSIAKSNDLYIDRQRELLNYIASMMSSYNAQSNKTIFKQLVKTRRLVINAAYGECFSRKIKKCSLVQKKHRLPLKVLFGSKLSSKEFMREFIIRMFPLAESYRIFSLLFKIKK